MDVEKDKGNGKVHFRDSASQEALRTYKRRRQPEPEPQEQPQLQLQQQPEPEPQQQQQQPQPQPELEQQQQQPKPEPVTGDVVAQQVTETFWKSRDIGWKHGIMIDDNRQHWKCMYCHLTRYGGGVSRLKRHLAGDLDVKMCPKVPADVSEKIREHLRRKREKRKNQAAQNCDNYITNKNTCDDSRTEKDPLPVDSEVLTGVVTVLEEVTNQTNHDNPEPAYPKAPMMLRGVRDIGWEHAVDLDGNKRRWQCKWCALCRSGGVTTLKAHLTDSSCPNIPKEISKKVLNFIEEKRAARHLFNSNTRSPFNIRFDKDLVNLSQIQEEGSLPLPDDQNPSRNARHMQTSENHTINEVAAGSNQRCAERSGEPLDCCEQLMESSHQPEEHCTLEHGRSQVLGNNKHHIMDDKTGHSEHKEIFKQPQKTRFNMRKHIVTVDETTKHWRCRYCEIPGSDEEDPPQPTQSAANQEISEPLAKMLSELVHSVANINTYLAARDNQFLFGMQGAGTTAGCNSSPPFLPDCQNSPAYHSSLQCKSTQSASMRYYATPMIYPLYKRPICSWASCPIRFVSTSSYDSREISKQQCTGHAHMSEPGECRRQGLCYNYDEPYVRGHKCQRLFYIEVSNFVDEDNMEEVVDMATDDATD
ncbi:hypothetical protein GUJ93_ZPchr0001g30891 [Zizania palustris]|uniref:BED-type domain-containing protein n=1 Tax=Zizania palustris TaxID=103762 RepID=A0A8J5RPU8_ZIZPA|nr:hypothetical protein GUJ93_ZPchr0001g30891 [Zizania palustris]